MYKRQAYGHGNLDSWSRYLLQQNGLRVREINKGMLGSLRGLVGEAEQELETGTLHVRFAFAEDGQRLINVSLMGPADTADAKMVWSATLRSFDLSHPRGSSVPLTNTTVSRPKQPPEADGMATAFARHALADDASALAPWNTFYAAARVAGRGRAAKVVALDGAERRATLAAGSIMAQIDIPFGWHAIDDGQSLMLHGAGTGVRIRLSFVACGEADAENLLQQFETRARTDSPNPLQFTRVRRGARLALRIDGRREGGAPVQELYQLVPGPDAARLLQVLAVAEPARAEGAADLVDLLLQSVVFGRFDFSLPAEGEAAAEAPAEPEQPSWWPEAVRLEREGNLADAEQLILHASDRVRGLLEVARLYRDRALRLARHGDTRGAAQASEQMERWAERHAATAVDQEQREALLYERTLTLMHD